MDGYKISAKALAAKRTVYCSKNRLWWHPGALFHAARANGTPIQMTRAIATAIDCGDLVRHVGADTPPTAAVTGAQVVPAAAALPPAAPAPPVASSAPVAPVQGASVVSTSVVGAAIADRRTGAHSTGAPSAEGASVVSTSVVGAAIADRRTDAPTTDAPSVTTLLIRLVRGREKDRINALLERETDVSFIITNAQGQSEYLQKARGWQRPA